MHIVMLIAGGLILLAILLVGTMVVGGRERAPGMARFFIWIWLGASIANGIVGVVQAGIPIINEIAAFVPIFGVPAGIAWLIERRLRA